MNIMKEGDPGGTMALMLRKKCLLSVDFKMKNAKEKKSHQKRLNRYYYTLCE